MCNVSLSLELSETNQDYIKLENIPIPQVGNQIFVNNLRMSRVFQKENVSFFIFEVKKVTLCLNHDLEPFYLVKAELIDMKN